MAPEVITPEQRALDGIRQREEVVFHRMAQKRSKADRLRNLADSADADADDYAAELAGLNAIREQLLGQRTTGGHCDLCAGKCRYPETGSNT